MDCVPALLQTVAKLPSGAS